MKSVLLVCHAEREVQMTQENTKGLTNTKFRDSSSKIIFKAPILCAQFLRDYVDIPMLKDVRPEDIKDETDRFVHLFTEERDSDVVKRIRLKKGKMPFYLVSLIEHKSEVDYNVVMQIFRYMAFIWEDYEYIEKVTTGTPEYLLGIISQIIEILLSRLNVSQEEAAEFVRQVKERRMV